MLQEQVSLPDGAMIQGQGGERFIIEGLLAKGGFSSVYLARERRVRDKLFALKEINDPRKQELQQLTFEAELLQRLDHDSLPHVYQVFEDERLHRVYMPMDYIEGPDLEAMRLQQPDKRFSLPVAFSLMTPIVEAISYLHQQEPPVIHRDIKPANIVVTLDASKPYLVDFGLAKEYVEDKTTNVFRYGTPGYAAPEQYGQGTNLRTDIYALGATLYTLLTGSIPVDALTRTVQRQGEDPLLLANKVCSAVPFPVARVLQRAMSLRSEDRYASVDEFWQALSVAALPRTQKQEPAQTGPLIGTNGTLLPSMTRQEMAQLSMQRVQRVGQQGNVRTRTYEVRRKKDILTYVFVFLVVLILLGVSVYAFWYYKPWMQLATKHTSTSVTRSVASSTIAPRGTVRVPDYFQLEQFYQGSANVQETGYVNGIGGGKQNFYLYITHQEQEDFTCNFQGLGGSYDCEGKVKRTDTLKDTQFEITFTLHAKKPVSDEEFRFNGGIRLGDGDLPLTFNSVDQNGNITGDIHGDCVLHPSQ